MSALVPFVWKTPRELDRLGCCCCSLGALGGLGHYCVARAMTYASANFMAPFNYTQMIGSVIVGYLMFAEVPDLYTWLGTALIVGAGLLVGWQGRRRRPNVESVGEEAMPYLVAADLPTVPAGERFRALLERPGILQMPGAHNGMAALQAQGRRASTRSISPARR